MNSPARHLSAGMGLSFLCWSVPHQPTKLKNQRDYFGSDSQDPMVHESLAPSFGTLDNAVQSVKELDDKLKVVMNDTHAWISQLTTTSSQFMIAFSLKELLKYKQNGALNWENIERCFSANTYLVSMEQPQEITKQYISESSSDFHFDGSPDPSLVQKVGFTLRGQVTHLMSCKGDELVAERGLSRSRYQK